MGRYARDVDAVVEAGNDAGFRRIDPEQVTEIREVFGVRGPKEADEFDIGIKGLRGRLQLRFEVYDGHDIRPPVEDVKDFQLRSGDEPEILDTELAEIEGKNVGIRDDTVEGTDERDGFRNLDREEVTILIEDRKAFRSDPGKGLFDLFRGSVMHHFCFRFREINREKAENTAAGRRWLNGAENGGSEGVDGWANRPPLSMVGGP